MNYGAAILTTDYSVRPDELARLLEDRGFESAWYMEHTHIPLSRTTLPTGLPIPKESSHVHDLFVAMTAAAVATTRIRIGSGICIVPERDPIITAKAVASIDSLSGGRLIFGIGGGWNEEEMENHGTPFRKRWRVLRENVLAMKDIWTNEASCRS